MSRLRAAFQGRRGAVLSVTLIVWALALFDLTLLPRVAGQYLGDAAVEASSSASR